MNKTRLKILEILCQNCRISTTKLAKAIRKPRHIVNYHKDQMIKEGIIINNELILNYDSLGYKEYLVYLKLFHYSKLKEKLVEYVAKHENVKWFGEVFPNYNVRIGILAKNIEEFERVMDEIESVCGDNLLEKQVLINRELVKKESYTTRKVIEKLKPKTELTLNTKEKKLIRTLYYNPIAPLLELSKKSGLTIEACRQKIKQFQNKGLILGFSAKYEMTKIGINFWCVLLARLNNLDKNYEKLKTLLYSNLCYGRTRRTFGTWNIEMTVFVSSYHDLIEIITQLEHYFGDDFESYELQVYVKRLMEHTLPKSIMSRTTNHRLVA